ncbi:MAG: 4a-hydroxytetrahydrobiopterin dehydratase [Bryobacteraceae bacterium]|nr:4a-hydroxytetrahydrobiopterin dehydratase [Bryobacteraceae bacterium]
MSHEKYSEQALADALASLPDWSVEAGKLHREYKFVDFAYAFAFMAGAATMIEKLDHHPEWFNVYSTVRIDLWTHTSGGITPMDTKLASQLEALAQKLL